MKKILLTCIAIAAIAITTKAQTPTLNGAQAGQTYVLSTSLSSGTLDLVNPYTWSEVSDVNNITIFSGATNTISASIVIAGGATNGQQATVQVIANNPASAGSCSSSAQQLIIIVGNATFTATVAANQSVCQGSSASIAVTLSKTGGTITGFSYFIDANNDGIRQPTETLQAGTLNSQISGTITLNTSVAAIQNIIISSISGTVGGFPVASVSTASQAVTINALPVINQITF